MATCRTLLIIAGIQKNRADDKEISPTLRELKKKEAAFTKVHMHGRIVGHCSGEAERTTAEWRAAGLLEGWSRSLGALQASGAVVQCAGSFFEGASLEDDVIKVAKSKGVVIDVIVIAFKYEEIKRLGRGNSWGSAPAGLLGGNDKIETMLQRIARRAQCSVYNIYEDKVKYAKYAGPRREASGVSSEGVFVDPPAGLPMGHAPTLGVSRSLPNRRPYSGPSTPSRFSPGHFHASPPATVGQRGYSAPFYPTSMPAAENLSTPSPGGESGPRGSSTNRDYPHFPASPIAVASAPPFFAAHGSPRQLFPGSGGVAAPSSNEPQMSNHWGRMSDHAGLTGAGFPQRTSSFRHPGSVVEYSLEEVAGATSEFSEDLKVGEGGSGVVYRGSLRGTEVAVKKLELDGLRRPVEFKHEVELHTTLRHPNIVTLMGCCSEAFCLVYELCAQGSLQERLADVTRPLAWYTRVRIVLEIATPLLWMHKQNILHCDIKPANILVHANGTAKLGDVGIARVMEPSTDARTAAITRGFTGAGMTSTLRGSFGYVDPALFAGFFLAPSSDVYALGICILQLLTNLDAGTIKRVVQAAYEAKDMAAILDETAGDWPMESVVEDLTHLGLRCTDLDQDKRADLETEVLPMLTRLSAIARAAEQHELERMQSAAAAFAAMRAPGARPRDNRDLMESQAICPISLVMMENPVMAADGITYEKSSIQDWMKISPTSPITGEEFASLNLIPNLSVKSFIEEWKVRNRGQTTDLHA